MAAGEYVWIAEADDFCENTFLEKAMEALETNRDADLFFAGSYQNFNDEEEIIHRRFDKWSMPKFKLPKGEKYYVFDGRFYIKNYMSFNNCIYNASGVVFRKAAADEKAWEYVDSFYRLGDWALWSYIIEKSKVVICNEPLNRFRMHPISATRKFSNEYAYILDAFRLVIKNSGALSKRRRMVRVMRIYKHARHVLGHGKRWRHFNESLAETYGENFIREAKMFNYFNKMLIVTPWHIGFTEARRIRPGV